MLAPGSRMGSGCGDRSRRCKSDGTVLANGKQDHGIDNGSLNRKHENEAASSTSTHVLVFPFPLQGHINSMVRLAELLCLSGIQHVTFVTTHRSHSRLMANKHTSRGHHPGIQFRSIADGMPDAYEGEADPALRAWKLHQSLAVVFPQQLLPLVGGNELLPPVTCAIVDGLASFAIDAFLEADIPVVAFRTISACSFWVYNSIPDLIQAGELPFQADGESCDLDKAIRSIPGMEAGLLRRRDLPKHARVKDIDNEPICRLLHTETRNDLHATALLLNTMEAMESPVLSLIRSEIPTTFAVGPIHALLLQMRNNPVQPFSEVSLQQLPLVTAAKDEEAPGSKNHSSSTRMSLWEEDLSCIAWLDKQPPKSVVYVSFGSLTIMTKEQVTELWHGLVASEQRFLWVLRSDALAEADVAGEATIPGSNTRCRGTAAVPHSERYLLVHWAPQEEVLNHPSVGGFFTHSGWNSTLECAVTGVPMLCCPFFADQHVNSRFVDHVWKVGMDLKDIFDRDTVAEAVRSLIEGFQEPRAAAAKLAEAAKAAVAPGGSSYSDFQQLIHCIKLGYFTR